MYLPIMQHSSTEKWLRFTEYKNSNRGLNGSAALRTFACLFSASVLLLEISISSLSPLLSLSHTLVCNHCLATNFLNARLKPLKRSPLPQFFPHCENKQPRVLRPSHSSPARALEKGIFLFFVLFLCCEAAKTNVSERE